MIDVVMIMKIAGLGLILWAIEEVLEQAGLKTPKKYVGIIGTLVILMVVIGEILKFFETVQTMFTF
ncbi:MAG: SpoIIIAC/SpoIIIAD family protein [Cellulosilyticaceae bacterium]